MTTIPFALYDAFTDTIFGGSQAGVVLNAAGLSKETRQKIACEIGLPATGFITSYNATAIHAHFHSTVTEYPMCGHGTICLISHMLEIGALHCRSGSSLKVDLHLPSTIARVEICRQENGYPLVMLDIRPPAVHEHEIYVTQLTGLVSLQKQDYDPRWPVETASGDFVHLIVPLKNLEAMRRIRPDLVGISEYYGSFGIQTLTVFCTETEHADATLHVRDFCPAVGVSESAAAGTTNAALASYLIRHGIVQANADGRINIRAEQGYEIGRPGTIYSDVAMNGNDICRLQVGGTARKVIDGTLYLPADT
ncbi:MAG: PhzF family phenazine biosynthesis protein [Gammaproteobacteria bacterium]|nr:PhzF family phenazine biosynthesis protein [Gammaproteobacteria bacterium]